MGKKKIAWRRDSTNYYSDISDAMIVTNVSKYSCFGAPHFLLIKNEEYGNKELLGMGFCSHLGPFPCLCNNYSDFDSETTELSLMAKSESKYSKEKSTFKRMPLEVEYQGNREKIDNSNVHMLSKDNYQQWKENMKPNIMNLDVWYLVCNGYTKIPPSDEEVYKNSKALSYIFYNLPDSTLNKVMHYTIANKVWDKLQEIHE